MNTNDIEIEIKFKLYNEEKIKHFLNKNGELVSENVYQKDTYYTPSHRDFFSITYPSEWLRIRQSDKGDSVNFKYFYPYNSPNTDYCDEFESNVDNIKAIQKIFESIDIKEIVTVEKYRTTWNYKDAEIVIDKVNDLGTFMELELKKEIQNPLEGKKILFDILKDLNAKIDSSLEIDRGYPYLLLEKKGYKFV